jgi:flagellar M-ring protein FliF
MQSILLKLRTWWETADRTQKSVTIFGSLFLVLLIAGTVYFAGRPKMEVLFRGLSPQDQGMVANELTKLGIAYEQDRAGNISVPGNQVAEVQGKLALAQKMPSSGHPGYSDLKDMGIMNTPGVENDRRKSIMEGEIAKSIEAIEGVASARVHLNSGEESAFARTSKPASASVIITESAAGTVGGEEARAIQRLVQFAVSGLTAKNITVISSSGRTLIDAGDMGAGGTIANERLVAENAEARRREASLQSRLDMVFGKGNSVVSIPVLELNFDQTEQRKNEELPTKPKVIEKNTETMGGGASSANGVAGTASNGAPATPTGSESDRSYSGTQEAKEMAMTRTESTTVFATGNLKRMAINVLVNSTKITDANSVQQLIAGELGPLAQDRANFAFTVTPVAFDTTAAETAKKAEAAATSAASKQQMMSILPIVALLIVGFMVVKAISKVSKSSNVLVAALPGGGMMPLGASSAQQVLIEEAGGKVAVDATSDKAIRAAREGKIVGVVPKEIRGGEAGILAEGQTMHQNQSAAELMQFVEQENPVLIAKIPDHINIPLEQIKKLAEERPENIAMLLKTWLLNEK